MLKKSIFKGVNVFVLMETIKVLVTDDQEMIRKGIEIMLQEISEIKLVGFASNGREALDLVAKKLPDVLILDVEMPDINGLVLTRRLVRDFPDTKIIILSAFEKSDYVDKALNAGASGYLSKSAFMQDLSWAIQLVHRGYSAFKTDLLQEATVDRELLFKECQEKAILLEEDLYRQKLKPSKRPSSVAILRWFRKIAIIKFLLLPIVYLRKTKLVTKLKYQVDLAITKNIERILKYCDRFWSK